MNSEIIATIDAEISKLQQVRTLLANTSDTLPATSAGRGRPKGSTNKAVEPAPAKRQMSDEAKARIGEAQRKRHAAKKLAHRKVPKAFKAAAKEATKPVDEAVADEFVGS